MKLSISVATITLALLQVAYSAPTELETRQLRECKIGSTDPQWMCLPGDVCYKIGGGPWSGFLFYICGPAT